MANRTDAERLKLLAKLRAKLATTDMDSYSGGGGFWSPPEGRSTIRILPSVGTMEDGIFFQEVGKHFLSKDVQLYCPKFTAGLDCPICDMRDQMYKQGSKTDKELAKDLGVRRMFWMNIIDRSNEDAGPMIFTPGVTIMNALANLVSDPDYGDITDELDGFDIKITRKGKGLDTKYEVLPAPRPKPIHDDDDKIDEWLDAAKDLTYVLVSMDPSEDAELSKGHAVYLQPYERIQEQFDMYVNTESVSDEDVDEDVDDDDEEPVEVKPVRRTRKSKPVVEDEDDVDEEEDDVKQEMETRRAARKTVRRRRS